MTERKYSVSEIDRMRNAVERYSFGSGSYFPKERIIQIEERVRTYMVAGVDPDGLETELREVHSKRVERENRVVRTIDFEDGTKLEYKANGGISANGGQSSVELERIMKGERL